jgi:hypothetical protein
VRRDEVTSNEPHVNAEQAQSARDMVRTAGGLYRDQAAAGNSVRQAKKRAADNGLPMTMPPERSIACTW